MQIIAVVYAASSSLATPTLVWATGTDSNGVLQTTQSEYTQTFTLFFDDVVTPESGAIGLGSISGQVGEIRTYDRQTISRQNGAESIKRNNLFMNLSGLTRVFMLIPFFMGGLVLLL